MIYKIFYCNGQRFALKGQWMGVHKLAPKLIAPSIEGEDGSVNIVDPRALVVDIDNRIVYNGREWRHQMRSYLRNAMPEDWPQSIIKLFHK